MTITRRDLEAKGFRVPPKGGLAVRVREVGHAPGARGEEPFSVQALDPSIRGTAANHTGYAWLRRVEGCGAQVSSCPIRLRTKSREDRAVELVSKLPGVLHAKVLTVVEATYFRRSSQAGADSIIGLSLAVGVCVGAARLIGGAGKLVDPDWARQITRRQGKKARHEWAREVLQAQGCLWPGQATSEHERDAVVLAVCWAREQGFL